MTTGKDASQVQSVPAVGNLDSALSQITRTASENTAKSAQMASEQRDWQERQNALAMQFNAQEAAKSRSWQEYMSNTEGVDSSGSIKVNDFRKILTLKYRFGINTATAHQHICYAVDRKLSVNDLDIIFVKFL